jgi:parallel beta-helix repeat protein
MNKKWLVKTLAMGIVILFVEASVVSALNINTFKKSKPVNLGNWLYVGGSGPGNYTKIQDAIDNAIDGDTVFVYNGTYNQNENIKIDKSISLIGENKFNTIINGGGISINVSNVNISGFTIQNGVVFVILLDPDIPSNNNIYDNIFKQEDNSFGIGGIAIASSFNTISQNSFFNCGLWVFSYPNFIYDNTVNGKPLVYLENISDKVIDDAGQIILMDCNNITINNLQIFNTTVGIELFDTNNSYISGNELMNNLLGIALLNSNNNRIFGNILLNNSIGLCITSGRYNTISKNSFDNKILNLLFADATSNLFSYNNFKYLLKIDNIFSLYSNNIWSGNFWNKPRLLPVLIWNFKTTKFRIIPIVPYSLDIDPRPAKKPNDINGAESTYIEFKMDIQKVRMPTNSLFLKIFNKLQFFEVIISRIMNTKKVV